MFVALDAFVAFEPFVASETASFPGLVCFSTSDDDLCDGRFLGVILPIIPSHCSERAQLVLKLPVDGIVRVRRNIAVDGNGVRI
jgi:hypothetical protein